jgi:hypothetical protein
MIQTAQVSFYTADPDSLIIRISGFEPAEVSARNQDSAESLPN